MKHYLLLRFHSGFLTPALFEFTQSTFAKLEDEINGIQKVAVFRNCVPRESNMDLMVTMTLEDKSTLPIYLEHPLHKAFIARVGEHIVERSTFDRE